MNTLTLSNVRGKVAQELSDVAIAQQDLLRARKALVASVEKARAAGATNQEIGEVLGVTRQRVSQMVKKP